MRVEYVSYLLCITKASVMTVDMQLYAYLLHGLYHYLQFDMHERKSKIYLKIIASKCSIFDTQIEILFYFKNRILIDDIIINRNGEDKCLKSNE